MKPKRFNLKMRTRIAATVSAIVFFSVIMGSFLMINRMTEAYELELGKRVMAIGQSLAQSPTIQEGLAQAEGWRIIQPVAERVRLATDVEYVVVFDMEKKRYSHPLEDRIGLPFAGGDEGPALAEQSYVSKAQGVKGASIRAFVPVMDQEGATQIGVVVVGVLVPTFLQILWDYRADLYLSLLLGTIFGIVGAIWVANRIKLQMFNMEPLDIAHLLEEREAVIESIAEGIIVIDREERITVFNKQAARMMNISQNVIGKKIREVISDSRLPEVLKDGKPQYHQLRQINGTVILTNRVPIKFKGNILGAMSTFQDRTEVYQLAEQLTGVQKFIGALRAQNHEYLNKLHTIAGLIQLQRYEEVMDKILSFNREKEAETHFLTQRIKDYSISGLIMGKISHAREQGVELEVDPQTSLPVLPSNIKETDLLMVIGNLLENAIYAANRSNRKEKKVTFFIEGNEDGIEISVTDNGIGMTPEVLARVFDYGFTTKGDKGQGIGLYLVKQFIDLHGGEIFVDSQVNEGTRFDVILPGPDWET
ncbi:ATP-binding protein [Effusibacillus lacus]|uniref:histidine kinase n=1 Tax=Effusibacillus lacus TaxID=1348429 RepID=A0A292YN88_9BACL|nr:sensor histidine kinase [Effusibacillus lacus]TCS71409.1 two-component system sensor histidine kinase DctS [Effusibacillus lacus]GAX89940.1 histidine kinase [Effusibacillus lacus]